MVRTTVHLTGFSVLEMQDLHASIYNRADTNKRWLPNTTFFFLTHSRSHWNTGNIWESEPSDDNYRNPAREKNVQRRPDGHAIINPTSAPESSPHTLHITASERWLVMLLLHIPKPILRERHALTLCSRELIMILVCSVFSSFEVRNFVIAKSLVPKDVTLRGTKTFIVKRWLKRQTTGNDSMEVKFSIKISFIPWIDPCRIWWRGLGSKSSG